VAGLVTGGFGGPRRKAGPTGATKVGAWESLPASRFFLCCVGARPNGRAGLAKGTGSGFFKRPWGAMGGTGNPRDSTAGANDCAGLGIDKAGNPLHGESLFESDKADWEESQWKII